MEVAVAQRVQIILEDDYDGGDADETVSFALDGAEYEIDLSSANSAKLRDELAVWIGHARKTGGRRRRTGASSSTSGGAASKPADGASSTSEIRAWALANGHEVSSRGRVSSEVREAYERAHS
jgi:hypothetical protein